MTRPVPDGTKREQLPPAVIAQLKALPPAITPELGQAVWALLTPFHEKIGYTAPRIDRDLRYGDHPRHRLDVHTGEEPPVAAPVFLFVHGGGFVGGDKNVPGTPRHDLVGAWAARQGWVGVTMTYRLAPEHQWPAGAQDVAAAVGWIRDNIAGHGGDPGKIVVAGNSAGAVHVASFITGQGGGSLEGVAGAALLSGIYDLAPDNRGALEHVYYGDTPAEAASTLPGLVDSPVPLLFSVAERDPVNFHAQAAGVVAAWQAKHGAVPDLVRVEGHNHLSTIASLGIDEPALGVALRRFVERNTTRAGVF
ncbi:alpha/beta hydrolase [Amycolatopsis sacchari]|uniref:Acetyl esterase/lipase n=1 Tax=Amycolatopsis sacchari TaxID=115433 RepID=A0A1I3UR43_9PSEU|nr:alpha/beta hydrolase fold domain-containing protein [Amycolatopsis sacchari]SFJ84291.1 Acetyl esterase/lipase [Amycolatopsis sacchari]